LILVNIAVHVLRLLLSIEIESDLIEALAFVPARYTEDVRAAGGSAPGTIFAPIAYQFLHAGWLHLGINAATLAAFGPPIERLLGPRRFLVFYLLCGVLAAAGQLVLDPYSTEAMIGASGGIAGLFGALLMLMGLRRGGARWILAVLAIVIVIQLAFGLVGMPGTDGVDIAWAAHIAGLLAGLLLIRFFIPKPSRR